MDNPGAAVRGKSQSNGRAANMAAERNREGGARRNALNDALRAALLGD